MARNPAALISALALMVGCAPPQPLVVQTPFDPAAGAWATARGAGSISGQAFLRLRWAAAS
jgi:hypothetical protein